MALNVRETQGGSGIIIEGADQFLRGLQNIAPDLSKELKDRLLTIGDRIIDNARGKVPSKSPLSRWERVPIDPAAWHAKFNKNGRVKQRAGGFPAYDAGKIRAGLKASTSKPKGAKGGAILYLTNKDAAGSIFEVVGRRRNPSNASGAHFIKTLQDFEPASRVIWAAYDESGRKRVQQEILDTCIDIEEEFNRRFGDEGFSEGQR